MEKYFINEIGMHHVYNSAFMHQLRDEENAKFRDYLKEILQTNPAMLERFVNFLTTPDEPPAVLQFGRERKYLGACRLLACMPGLPLFGHGQWEGFSEHYGMDIARPTQPEVIDAELVAQHDRHIQPLLMQRSRFSSAENFYLYDFAGENGIDENVVVFSVSAGDDHSLVIFNNAPRPARGSLMHTIPQLNRAEDGKVKSRPLWESLSCPENKAAQLTLTDLTQGDRITVSLDILKENGLALELNAYESHVFKVSWN
jgi:hypothetical protein